MDANTPLPANIASPENPETAQFSFQDIVFKIKHLALRVVPLIILAYGSVELYEELVKIFYIFPHLSELYKLSNFSDEFFISIYRRSILITATATIGMIYAGVLISHREHLAHWLHIITGVAFLILSQFILKGTDPIEPEGYHAIPPAPTIENLINSTSMQEAVLLFKIHPADTTSTLASDEATSSSILENDHSNN